MLEKSTSPLSIMREVFEYCAQNDYASVKRLKIVLKVLSFARSGDPIRTETVRVKLC